MKINGESLPVEAYEVEAKGLTIKSPPAGASACLTVAASCRLLLLGCCRVHECVLWDGSQGSRHQGATCRCVLVPCCFTRTETPAVAG